MSITINHQTNDISAPGGTVTINGQSVTGGGGGASTLDSLTDVTATSPSNGQALAWNSTTSQWEPQGGSIPAGGTVSQVLTKNSSTNYDVSWINYGNEQTATITSSAGAATLNTNNATVFLHTLTENTTYTFSNPPSSGTAYGITLKVTQDTTARTITWPASVKWAGTTAPTLSTGSGKIDVFVFFTHDAGTNWYGFTGGQNFS